MSKMNKISRFLDHLFLLQEKIEIQSVIKNNNSINVKAFNYSTHSLISIPIKNIDTYSLPKEERNKLSLMLSKLMNVSIRV